jgi:hypothetical protein
VRALRIAKKKKRTSSSPRWCTSGRCSTTSNDRRRLIRDPHDFHQQCLLFHIKRGRGRLIYRVIIHLERWGEKKVTVTGKPTSSRQHMGTALCEVVAGAGNTGERTCERLLECYIWVHVVQRRDEAEFFLNLLFV